MTLNVWIFFLNEVVINFFFYLTLDTLAGSIFMLFFLAMVSPQGMVSALRKSNSTRLQYLTFLLVFVFTVYSLPIS